jgi:hypothetical protein
MLNFQQELKRKFNRSNAETVLDVREIPSNNQITGLLDNLEHNFGHGKNHACEIYAVLNLPGFLMHGPMLLLEEEYQKTRASFGRRETFFEALRFSFRRFPHESWEEFLIFVLGDEPDG